MGPTPELFDLSLESIVQGRDLAITSFRQETSGPPVHKSLLEAE